MVIASFVSDCSADCKQIFKRFDAFFPDANLLSALDISLTNGVAQIAEYGPLFNTGLETQGIAGDGGMTPVAVDWRRRSGGTRDAGVQTPAEDWAVGRASSAEEHWSN